MAVITAGTVTQSLNGTIVTFTDQTTGITGLVSRVLNIYNANEVLLTTINMGSSVTATYNISSDLYLTFIETIVSNEGTNTLIINYLSTAFYDVIFANTIAQLGCSCDCASEQLTYTDIAQLFRSAALRFALAGLGVSAQLNITAANTVISGQ